MIAIIDYGLGNLKSVKYALDRLGKDSILTERPEDLFAASGVILPGVGAFEQAMANLRGKGLVEPIRAVAASGKPLVGICLGVQLLLSQSQEYGVHAGLDIIPGQVVRFAENLTVPHMGWNQVEQAIPCPLFEGVADKAFFYFAHSYYLQPDSADVAVGMTDYGGRYCSMVQSGNVFGTQFHPEKSGPVGLVMLENFCRLCEK